MTPPELLASLVADLRAESASLDSVVAGLPTEQWHRPTPAEGWDIADTISHLGSSDQAALRSISDPDGFPTWLLSEVAPDIEAYLASHLEPARTLPTPDLLGWWRQVRDALADALAGLAPGVRLPWFGPPMSGPAFVVARLMETWAHGVDVSDTLDSPPSATSRLRHIADLGYRTRGWSYTVRGLTVPAGDVRLELAGPDGQDWSWGPAEAKDFVHGAALDFCLLVTQRRHRDDTALTAEGDLAMEWLGIAQAFAGQIGAGRPPLAAKSAARSGGAK